MSQEAEWKPRGPFRREPFEGAEQIIDAAGDVVCDAPGSLLPEEWEPRAQAILAIPAMTNALVALLAWYASLPEHAFIPNAEALQPLLGQAAALTRN